MKNVSAYEKDIFNNLLQDSSLIIWVGSFNFFKVLNSTGWFGHLIFFFEITLDLLNFSSIRKYFIRNCHIPKLANRVSNNND